MSSIWCRLLEAHDKRDLVEISQLIDLTDKPVSLARDEIGWSKVKANASNCICCCCNNSITLVTTNDSYVLDHVPLDNIQFAQANANLQYLALSNHRKLAIIDLVDNDINCGCYSNNNLPSETKVVNLAAYGLTMSDIILWRWLDESTLAILSYGALYTCSVSQQHINHPAYTAFSNRSRYLSMQKIFEVHQNLSALCQVSDIQRDASGNLYAISSLYSTSSLLKLNLLNAQQQHVKSQHPPATATNSSNSSTTLRPSYGSMPSRLSQLVNNDHSSDSLKSEHLFDSHRSQASPPPPNSGEDEICGLVQIYCKIRDRSQLIQAHAVTFTSPAPQVAPPLSPSATLENESLGDKQQRRPTILVAANKVGHQMRVHFVEMSTYDNYPSTGQNASPMTRFDRSSSKDFPTSIVCSHISSPNSSKDLHVAFITTKHGQLFVCSVTHSTILFNATITNDIISSAILESRTHGLMVICRNGQVLLVQLNVAKLMRLLDDSRTLRHTVSSNNVLHGSIDMSNNGSIADESGNSSTGTKVAETQLSTSLDMGLDVLISTKL